MLVTARQLGRNQQEAVDAAHEAPSNLLMRAEAQAGTGTSAVSIKVLPLLVVRGATEIAFPSRAREGAVDPKLHRPFCKRH